MVNAVWKFKETEGEVMSQKHKVEIFTAGCPICQEALAKIEDTACCEGCETEVINTQTSIGAEKAKTLGVSSIPAIAVDGELLDCCSRNSIDLTKLKKACE